MRPQRADKLVPDDFRDVGIIDHSFLKVIMC